MEEPRELLTLDDIKRLVDVFYERIRENSLLAPVFNAKIENRWPQHLEKMYRFWQTVLLEEHTYFGSPFMPHAGLPVDGEHFEAWVTLFKATVDELFTGAKADEAKWRAAKMAEMFESKIAYIKKNPLRIL
ncbi:MAG: group III truncated hemoglobin [Mucilaginibacter sp.]